MSRLRTPSFECDRCGSRSKITDTRVKEVLGRETVRRRRQCYKCYARWTTVEVSLERYEHMLKLVEEYFRVRALAAVEVNYGPDRETKADA
jgi:transcriptional regulator NrdR family protein